MHTHWDLRTVLVVTAGVWGAQALRLVLGGFWVNDGGVALLEHLLHKSIGADVIFTIGRAVVLHCGDKGEDEERPADVTLALCMIGILW